MSGLGENVKVALTRHSSSQIAHRFPRNSPFVKRQRSKTFSPFPAHDRIFVVTFLNPHRAKKESAHRSGREKTHGGATRKPAYSSQPSLLASHFLPERTSFLDRACLLSFLPNALPNPGNLDFLFKETCLERKIDQEQPKENTAQLVDMVLSDMSSVSSEAHFLCLGVCFLSFHFIYSLYLSLLDVFFCCLSLRFLAESSIL